MKNFLRGGALTSKILIVATAFAVSGFFINTASAAISTITINAPLVNDEWRGMQNIIWDAVGATPSDLVDIVYRTDAFSTWLVMGQVDATSGTFSWNTTGLPNADTYQIQIVDHSTPAVNTISGIFTVDNIVPVTTIALAPIAPDGLGSWYITVPTITLSCSDALSGCLAGGIKYRWNGFIGGYNTYTVPFVAPQGSNTLEWYSEDQAVNALGAHNIETVQTQTIKVDTILPTVAVTSTTVPGAYNAGDDINITLTFSEPVSSTGALNVNLNSGGSCSVPILTNATTGTCTYTVLAVENSAGLVATSITPSGVVEDVAGNDSTLIPTSNIDTAFPIVIDTTAPGAFIVGGVFARGGTEVASYWNFTNTSVDVVVPVANDTSLVGGTLQLQAEADGTFENVGPAFPITLGSLGTSIFYSISAAELEAISVFSEGDVITFTAIITDRAGNPMTGTQSVTTLTVDQTVPSVNAGTDKIVNAMAAQDATTSDGGSGLNTYAWTQTVGGGVITFSNQSGTTPTINPDTNITATTEEVHTLRLTVTDIAGNSASDDITFVWDTTPPTVVLTSSTPDPTNGLIFVIAQFSETVTGFDTTDIAVVNGAVDTFVAVDGDTYQFNVDPTDGASVAVTIDVPMATSVDAAGNANTASNQITRTSDTVAPAVSSITTTDANLDGTVDTATIVFTEAMKDSTFNFADFTIGGIPATNFSTGITANDDTVLLSHAGVAGTEAKTVAYTPGTAITDLAGNPIAGFSPTSTDEAGPVLLSAQTASVTTINATFSEDINGGTVNGSGSEFAVTGYAVSAASETSDGVVTLTVATMPTDAIPLITFTSALFEDSNGNTAPSPQFVTATDGVAPVLSGVSISSNNTNDSVQYAKEGNIVTVSFTTSEDVTIPNATIDGQTAIVSGGPTSWTITKVMDSDDTEGTVGFSFDVTDSVGNTATSNAVDDTSAILYDRTVPAVDTGTDKEVNAPVTQTAITSDGGSGIRSHLWTGPAGVIFTPNNTAVTNISANADGTYTLTLTIEDNAGNVNSDTMTFIWDTTNPEVEATSPYNNANGVSASAGTAKVIFYGGSGNIVLVDSSKVTLKDTTTNVVYSETISIEGGNGNSTTLNINYSALIPNTTYRINVQSGAVRDVAGNNFTGNLISYFTTAEIPDMTAPDAPVITTPSASVDANFYAIEGTVADDGGQRIVNVYNGASLAGSAVLSVGQVNWSVNVALTQDASNVFTAKATDGVGNVSNVSNSVTITEAATLAVIPTVTLNGSTIVSAYTVTEATARFALGLRFDTTNATSITVNGSPVTPASTITPATQAEASSLGLHVYNVVVTSSTGNTANITVAYNVVADAVPDTTKPVIILLGTNPQTLTVGDTYTELGATAADNIDGDITSDIVIASSTVNMAVAGTYTVTYNVLDVAGNAATEATRTVIVNAVFDDTAILEVTSTGATNSYATADDTFENGFKWVFHVTVPTTETQFSMKFSDFVSGTNSIPAANNIRFYSAQSSDASASTSAMTITAFDTYSSPITLAIDLDSSVAGRQIDVTVEMKVPTGTAGGSYSGSYGVQSL